MKIIERVTKFERFIYAALIAMLMVVLVFAIGELAWVLITSLTNPPPLLLENHELTNVLGVFLLVLIGVELLDTMLEYFRENAIHVEIVVLLSIIAIARKVILLDPTTTDGAELIGIGIIIIGLSAAYFLIKKAGITIGSGLPPKE
ncbi:MAG: phosphate-starvation-inducible PsiE family protein [Methanoregula sp.]|nr:phosphate-starvation-inducible PsiE family protein [Methanoregula sp.]